MPDVLSASGQAAGWLGGGGGGANYPVYESSVVAGLLLVASVAILHQNRSQTTSRGLTRQPPPVTSPAHFIF